MKPPRHHRRPPHAPQGKAPGGGPPTDWGEVAGWYDQLVGETGSEYHREVVLPGALRLLEPKPGQRILDVACGQGVLCRLLHQREPSLRITGVDAAGELIRMARERSDPAIRFVRGDARELPRLFGGGLEPSSAQTRADAQPPAAAPATPSTQGQIFDAAACILALQNLDPLPPVFAGVAQVLSPGGRFVMVLTHPAFRGPKFTAWGWDDAAKVQYRRVDRYLVPRKEPIVTHPGKDPGRYTWTFHRPLSLYVRLLRHAGLFVDALEEWPSHKESTSGPRAGAENLARREIPLFLALRAVKVQG